MSRWCFYRRILRLLRLKEPVRSTRTVLDILPRGCDACTINAFDVDIYRLDLVDCCTGWRDMTLNGENLARLQHEAEA